MRKVESIFRMLKCVSIAPNLTAATLAKLLDRSERGIYRYMSDLKKLGIPIKFQDGGYVLEDCDILSAIKLRPATTEAISELAESPLGE